MNVIIEYKFWRDCASGTTNQTANTFVESEEITGAPNREETHHEFYMYFVPLITPEVHRYLGTYKASESVPGSVSLSMKREKRVYIPARLMPRKTAPRVEGMLLAMALR